MYDLGDSFKNKNPEHLKAMDKVVFQGEKYRISVLTERLVRLEYDPNGIFHDYETSLVKNRYFPYPSFLIKEDSTFLVIETKYLQIKYVKNMPFTNKTLIGGILGEKNNWYYGKNKVSSFESFAKYLDKNSECPPLVNGLFSKDGYVAIDDNGVLFNENSNIVANEFKNHVDMYLFVYKNDFDLCLNDYFMLTGYPELIPRYALGNWWSRNYNYDQNAVLNLTETFKNHGVPLSVFLLENGWSKTDKEKYPKINNGFTFNKELFDKPNRLIEILHKRNVKLGVKVNPKYGFYPFETYYELASKYILPNKNGIIEFNPLNPKSMDLYFKMFLHPLQALGVDLFWNDYNDDGIKKHIVNDYMTKDQKRLGKRPLILSRPSEYGVHRYNAIYTGQLYVDWKSLQSMLFFNLNSSNMGVNWWSHDIGGSLGGIEDSDLYIRSIQLGVFSPILRFNTEKGHYFKREPWKWDSVTDNIATNYLRFRHKLIPYIYSEAYRYHQNGEMLIRPLYYTNLNLCDDSNYINQYYFGNSFMISPIINQMDEAINRSVQNIYIPDGTWYDFKTGKRFLENRKYISFYKNEDYPIFVKTGSIIPMAGDNSYMSTVNPSDLELHVFPGQNNIYHLYEDDGETYEYQNGKYFVTEFNYNYQKDNNTFIIRPFEGDNDVIPKMRNYKIVFRNVKSVDTVCVYLNNKIIPCTTSVINNNLVVSIENVDTSSQLVINYYGKDVEFDSLFNIEDSIDNILLDMKISTLLKDDISQILFSKKMNFSMKRLAIRNLKIKGLDSKNIKVFLKLIDYMEMQEAN